MRACMCAYGGVGVVSGWSLEMSLLLFLARRKRNSRNRREWRIWILTRVWKRKRREIPSSSKVRVQRGVIGR